jgi:hypothetical protein
LDLGQRARLLAAVGRERRFAVGPAEAEPLTDAAVTEARASGDGSTLTYALMAWRVTREAPDRLGARRSSDEELVAAASVAGDERQQFEARRLVLMDQLAAGDLPAAWEQLGILSAMAVRLGERRLAWLGPMWRAMRLLAEGPIDEAAQAVDLVYEQGRRANYLDVLAVHALQEYLVRRHRGTTEGADAAFVRSERYVGSRWVTFRASFDAETGRLVEARRDLDLALADPEVTLGGDRVVTATTTMVTDAVVALDDAPAARWLYERLLPWRGQVTVVGTGAALLGPTDHVLGRLAAVAGDATTAARHHHDALRLARRAGSPIAVAECAAALASWVPRAERARLAEEARSIGEVVGSRRLLSLAERAKPSS